MVCRNESKCLITSDEDFAQIIDFPPESYHGIIVLRHPRATLRGMKSLLAQVIATVSGSSPEGRLWIVEPGRIRVHESQDPGGTNGVT